jgi:hypothetical protein
MRVKINGHEIDADKVEIVRNNFSDVSALFVVVAGIVVCVWWFTQWS